MATEKGLSAAQIINAAKKKKFAPVYLLYGDESYYIDKICDAIVEEALDEDARDFNLAMYYGLDSDVNAVIAACKRYPMMSERQVVVIKEAQLLKDIDNLQYYVKSVLSSTILIVCCKSEKFKGEETLKIAKKSNDCVVFESKKLRFESEMTTVISSFVAEKGFKIQDKALIMLRDHIGGDVARIESELAKLTIIVPPGGELTPEIIERNIGVSKDYNDFELLSALSVKNALKALKIVEYFRANPKSGPVVRTTDMMFGLFSSLMIMLTSKDRSDAALMGLGIKKWELRNLKEASRYYSPASCYAIIHYLRELDLKSKGYNSRVNEYDLLKETIFKILAS